MYDFSVVLELIGLAAKKLEQYRSPRIALEEEWRSPTLTRTEIKVAWIPLGLDKTILRHWIS